MRVGVHVVNFSFPTERLGPMLREVGAVADEVGLDNLSVMDHYFQLEFMGRAEDPMLEAYTTLGFLAAATRDVELQVVMTGVTYRYPGLLAKIVATLDVLSGGRAALGIGAAWYEREHLAMGVPFPPVAERFERLEETLQIVLQMWSDDDGPYDGRHYHLAETICSPQPLRRPRPPIMVGGGGEKKTLRLVAQYADACNLFASPQQGVAPVQAKLDVLREHCERLGTDYDAIEKTVLYSAHVGADGSGVDEMLEHARELREIGVTEIHLMPHTDDAADFVRSLGARALPELHAL